MAAKTVSAVSRSWVRRSAAGSRMVQEVREVLELLVLEVPAVARRARRQATAGSTRDYRAAVWQEAAAGSVAGVANLATGSVADDVATC